MPDRSKKLATSPWLDHLERHLPIARLGEDPEGVHQVRVAAARLRVWLRLGGRRALSDDLRWLRDELGEVRDLDVLSELGGDAAQQTALRARWSEARQRMLPAFDAPRLRALLAALAASPPVPRARAAGLAHRWLRSTRLGGDRLDWTGAPDIELHAFRRRVRRLRYAIEWLGAPSKPVKHLAEELGQINDMAVWIERLERGEQPEGETLDGEEVRTRLAARRRDVGERWPALSRALKKVL